MLNERFARTMGFWQSLAPELVVPYSPEKEMSDSIR
jgi:hypothetical protein